MPFDANNPKPLRRTLKEIDTVNDNPSKSTRRVIQRIQPGTKFLGHYELLELIERGGMGIVFKARNRNDGSIVAIKEFISGEDIPTEDRDRFIREINTTKMLDHPNIIKVIDSGISKSNHYWFAMEYIAGGTLLEWLNEQNPSIEEICIVTQKIALAIGYAHSRGIVHRDLKPGNAMITKHGTPLVMDFGLAKDATSKLHLTNSGVAIGTYNYMPPEQAEGKLHHVDERSDIYSIGAILYQLLTGIPPFVGKSEIDILNQIINDEPIPINKINPEIDQDVQTITMKCLEKEKKNRYQSAAELSDDIERYLNNEKIKAIPPGNLLKTYRKLKRNRTFVFTLLILLAASFIVFSFYRKNAEYRKSAKEFTSKAIDVIVKSEREKRELQQQILNEQHGKWRLAFEDNFENGNYSENWDILSGTGKIVNGKLVIKPERNAYLVLKRQIAGNIRLEFDCEITSDYVSDISCFFNALYHPGKKHIEDYGYIIQYGGQNNTMNSIKKGITSDTETLWENKDNPLVKERVYHVSVEKVNDRINLTVNDRKIITLTDKNPLYGFNRNTLGFYLWKSTIKFDNIKVHILGTPERPDLFDVAQRHEMLGHYQTALNLYNDIYYSTLSLTRKEKAKRAIKSIDKKIMFLSRKKDYIEFTRNLWPESKTSISFDIENEALSLRIVDTKGMIKDLNNIISIPVNSLSIDSESLLDITALKYMPLNSLTLANVPIKNLSPLKGNTLKSLKIESAPDLIDISAIDGQPLEKLFISNTRISDISCLENCPLKTLTLINCPVKDIKTLNKLDLKHLKLEACDISDISAISGKTIHTLSLNKTKVQDINTLNTTKLRNLYLAHTRITDISTLTNSHILALDISNTPVKDFSPLKTSFINGLSASKTLLDNLDFVAPLKDHLTDMDISFTQIKDLSPLLDISQLDSLTIDKKQAENNKDILEKLKYTTINIREN